VTAPTVAWLGDRLVGWAEAVVPVEDRGLQFGESLYEVAPVTGGVARLLGEHAERMAAGAAPLGLEAGVPPPAAWEEIARALLAAEALGEGLLYAQLTGGCAPRAHLQATPPRPLLFAYLRPYRFPRAAEVARGIRAVTVPDPRWGRCDLKTTMLLPAVLAKREAARRGAQEALLVGPDGAVREGGSSNLFLLAGARLVTPPQGPHLLPGITREVVVALAREAGLEPVRGTVTAADLLRANELFVTSTTFLLMPVVAVDDRPVASGAPGPRTVELARRLRERLGVDEG
jgi:D-alanine transaminase